MVSEGYPFDAESSLPRDTASTRSTSSERMERIKRDITPGEAKTFSSSEERALRAAEGDLIFTGAAGVGAGVTGVGKPTAAERMD